MEHILNRSFVVLMGEFIIFRWKSIGTFSFEMSKVPKSVHIKNQKVKLNHIKNFI